MTPQKYSQLKAKILEACPEKFNIVLEKDWEESFYESNWEPDTLKYSEKEAILVEKLGSFLPRHMPVYDWNLPYIDAIILHIRRIYSQNITLCDILRAIDTTRLDYVVNLSGYFLKKRDNEIFEPSVSNLFWKFEKDSLDDQSDELKEWLYSLLCNE